MKIFAFCVAFVALVALNGCDVQSGMTKKGLEKYNPSPTPTINIPTPEPIDPADVVTVDTSLQGPTVNVNKPEEAKRAKCTKYNRVAINMNGQEVKIDGICKQVMINGDGNRVSVTAVSEVVINGTDNTVEYYKIANGKRPIVNDSVGGSSVTRSAAPAKD